MKFKLMFLINLVTYFLIGAIILSLCYHTVKGVRSVEHVGLKKTIERVWEGPKRKSK